MRTTIAAFLREPRVADPPRRVTRDWWLLGALLFGVAVEVAARPDLTWRPVSAIVGAVLATTVLWRRTYPLAAMTIMFAGNFLLDGVASLAGEQPVELYSAIAVLVLVYAVFRWASGHHGAIALAVMLAAWSLSILTTPTTIGDAIGGMVVILVPAELGIVVRRQDEVQRQELEQAKLREREQLARELHDTVAHHVSAIAVQAQAGRFVAANGSLDGAADALEIIENEASRTLVEMRAIIGSLRDPDVQSEVLDDLAPQRGVADIERLARSFTGAPSIEIELSGDLADLRPSVDAAIYRMAQESITNAVRHATGATRVAVNVQGDLEIVRLAVVDDGAARPQTAATGFGLVGMAERAELLGGRFAAGPEHGEGWTVQAEIPR